jgi:mono/diheme cytochrome c family protein
MEVMMARIGVAGITLVALLAWGLVSANNRLAAQSQDALVALGRQVFADQGCYGCHTVGPAGTPIGPDLRRAAARNAEADLARWLRDPAAQEQTHHMPNLHLSESEASALAAFIVSLR